MNTDVLILVTNDDGVDSKGLKELIKCLKELGEVVVFAPDGPRSGMSGAITSTQSITYSLIHKENNLTLYACSGTPVDCVKLALNEVLERRPDLLISGINHGGNHAISVHYSGTMGAVMEGCIFHVPSIGVSLMDHSPDADFSETCRLAVLLAREVLTEGIPHGTYLSLNVPVVIPVKGLAVCRQADGQWIKEFVVQKNTDGKMNYWLQGEYIDHEPVYPDNDTNRLNEGYASLVPCTIDVTNHAFIETLRQWNITDL